MDIAILLALQDFRNGLGALFAEFLKKMTFFGELNTTLVIFALVYWCISKEWGTYLMMGWSGNRIINGVLKVTVCAYRPWIRDPRIVPYGDSMTTATGYSFPSGHTTNAGTVFGGGAVRRDFPWAIRAVLFLIVVLVAFSRLYLGVHTPQDVLVGAAYSLLVMWLTLKLMHWLEEHPEKELLVVCIGIGISVLLALYAGLKPYPQDFDPEGQLIVDGAKMANDTFKAVGWVSAFLIGWVAERRWVGFSTEVSRMTKVTRCVVGLLGFYAVSLLLMPLIKEALSGPAGAMFSCFVQMLYISFLFPWCMMRIEQKSL
jgi:undecaprenyl-diphosphatase